MLQTQTSSKVPLKIKIEKLGGSNYHLQTNLKVCTLVTKLTILKKRRMAHQVSSKRCRVKGSSTVLADVVPLFGVFVDETLHDVDVALPRRKVERRPTVFVHKGHLCTGFKQNLDDLDNI